jgi:squalene synthase HpnC
MPRKLRYPVQVIYAFARAADDFADEGDVADSVRLANLEGFREQLRLIEAGSEPTTPLFKALADVIQTHQLPLQAFGDLLDAFSQDVVKKRYASFDELMDYCRRSANPVGTLMLHLYQQATPENLIYSDAICSALQLINFWQDVEIDFAKPRVYIPQADLQRFNVTEKQICEKICDDNWRELMQFEIRRARNLLVAGEPLGRALKGRIGLEMRLIIQGGLRILDKLEQRQYDMFRHRPKLKKIDWAIMLARAV